MIVEDDIEAKPSIPQRLLCGFSFLVIALIIALIVHKFFPNLNRVDLQMWAEIGATLVAVLVVTALWLHMKRH